MLHNERRRHHVGLLALLFAVGGTAAFVPAPNAFACPLCDSNTGKQVRACLLQGEPASKAALLLLPFPVFLAVILCIYFGHSVQSAAAAFGKRTVTGGGGGDAEIAGFDSADVIASKTVVGLNNTS